MTLSDKNIFKAKKYLFYYRRFAAAASPLRYFAASPLRRRRFAGSPLRRFAGSPPVKLNYFFFATSPPPRKKYFFIFLLGQKG